MCVAELRILMRERFVRVAFSISCVFSIQVWSSTPPASTILSQSFRPEQAVRAVQCCYGAFLRGAAWTEEMVKTPAMGVE